MSEQREEIELPNSYAMIELPDDAVEVKLSVKILLNSKLQTVERTMTTKEIREAFRAAEDYIPDDAIFQLTEEGRAYLDELDGKV